MNWTKHLLLGVGIGCATTLIACNYGGKANARDTTKDSTVAGEPRVYAATAADGTSITVDERRVREVYANSWQWQITPRGEVVIDYGLLVLDPAQAHTGKRAGLLTLSTRVVMTPQLLVQGRQPKYPAGASYGEDLVADDMEAHQTRLLIGFEMAFDGFSDVRSKLIQRVCLGHDVGANPAGDKPAFRRFLNEEQNLDIVKHSGISSFSLQ